MLQIRGEAFAYYFYFMQERMRLFWNRYEGEEIHLVEDNIIRNHRFTNVYRATDRVSQYLIRNVIYSHEKALDAESLLLNILIFKIFNRISTWEKISKAHGFIDARKFDPRAIIKTLDEVSRDGPVFNPAYIMTASSDDYRHLERKYARWLHMVDIEIVRTGKLKAILDAPSLEKIYGLLRECTFIGPFLAYQYTIDFNYSSAINFDENSFVVAGIGAQRGIKKCFQGLGKFSYEDAIIYTLENINTLREQYGFQFEQLFSRAPTLIDLQNCFCETDKLLRKKLPDLSVGNTRIKQIYRRNDESIRFFFPPKWRLGNVKN